MQSIRIMSRPPLRKRNGTSRASSEEHLPKYTYTKDISWPHFDNEPRVQKKQQVENQQSCILICLTILSSNQGHQPRCDNSIPHMGIWQIYRDTEQPQEKKTSQDKLSSNFLGGSFSNRDNIGTPIQFRRQGQPQHLKR